MAFFDFLNRGKLKNLANQAIYQYWIHSGVANQMADNPNEYLTKGYSGNTTVYSLINRIDAMRKQARLTLVDKSGKEVENHELRRFLKNVNPTTTTDDFISQLLIYFLTIGEYFIYKPTLTAGVNKGKVQELTMLPSADVEIIEGNVLDPVRGYKIDGSYSIELDKLEVYHGKKFNPNWNQERSLHGMSPLRAAANTVTKLNQIEITESKAFENQGPPYILFKESSGDAMQNRMTDTQRFDIVKKIKNASKDNNRSLPLVLKDKFGKLDLGQKLADLTVIESSNSGIIALCAVYGFPPELHGYGQKTYSNMDTARKSAWTDCIMPNLDVIERTLNSCLIDSVEEYANQGIQFKYDYSEVEELQAGMEIQVSWMNAAGWSGNEIRKATGKQPIDNPLMDEPRIPMGVTFLSDYVEPLDANKSFEDYK